MDHLDPHQRPPDRIKDVYKKYQKMKPKDLDQDLNIVDLPESLNTSAKDKFRIVDELNGHDLTAAFQAFSGQAGQTYADLPPNIPVYEHADMPGKTPFRYSFSLLEPHSQVIDSHCSSSPVIVLSLVASSIISAAIF